MRKLLARNTSMGLLSAVLVAPAIAQGIFTCVDSKGRRLTADRPIAECLDREQKEITPGGTVKRRIGPSLTADERAAEEAKAAKEAEERNRLAEEKKRDRALLTRYPDRAAHDKERTASIALIDGVIGAANKRMGELAAQRKRMDAELEFFKADPAKAPALLKRQIDENQLQMDGQKRFVANQEAEKQRINARADEELGKLKLLWAQLAGPATAAAPAAIKR